MNATPGLRCLAVLLVSTLTIAATTSAQRPAQNAAQNELVAAFVAFDRLYIPALALTKQEKPQPSRAAMKRLTEGWTRLDSKHGQARKADTKWDESFSQVGQLIEEARRQVAAGEYAQAHETLEGVRNIFRDLRKRQMIDYELDLLTDFHDAMEAIVKAAAGRSAGDLVDADIASLDQLTHEAIRLWQPVKSATFSSDRFQLDEEKQKRIQALISQESEVLDSLHHALEGGDKTRIVAAASQVRPVFAQLYMSFGDFPGP